MKLKIEVRYKFSEHFQQFEIFPEKTEGSGNYHLKFK